MHEAWLAAWRLCHRKLEAISNHTVMNLLRYLQLHFLPRADK